MADISYQLYCSRKFPPLERTLAMLAAAGYRDVEGFGGLYDDPAAFKAALDKAGLAMPTGHFGLGQIEGERDKMLAMARALDMQAVIVPYVMPADRPGDAAGWEAFAARLSAAGKPFREAGFAFGWHNHDFEFVPTSDGRTPQEIIAAADGVSLELDIGWVVRAGQDPVTWINRLGPKIIAAHVKDIAPAGQATDEDGWADVGHGTVTWGPIIAALHAVGCDRFVIEHDNPADDKRFATRSLATIQSW